MSDAGVSPPDTLDADLLLRIAQQDPDALVALYDRYRRLAFGLAYRLLGDPNVAEEVVQDAFMRVWQRAESFDAGRGNVRAWLLSIVHHRCIDHLRRRSATTHDLALDSIGSLESEVDVWRNVQATLDGEQVRAALARLSSEQREAIELAYFGGLTQTEIADRTGTPLGTIKSRLRLGLKQLRQQLIVDGDSAGTTGGD